MIGYTAAGIGSVMFLPQAIRSWRTKDTKGLSLSAYALFALVSLLWLIYGIMLMAGPVILVNVVLLILNSFIVALKLRYG